MGKVARNRATLEYIYYSINVDFNYEPVNFQLTVIVEILPDFHLLPSFRSGRTF